MLGPLVTGLLVKAPIGILVGLWVYRGLVKVGFSIDEGSCVRTGFIVGLREGLTDASSLETLDAGSLEGFVDEAVVVVVVGTELGTIMLMCRSMLTSFKISTQLSTSSDDGAGVGWTKRFVPR